MCRTVLLLLFLLCGLVYRAEAQSVERLTVAFYHLEPFFDTTDDTTSVADDACHAHGWTAERYAERLARTAQAIASLDDGGPNILALTNVENRRVLEDLKRTDALADGRYAVLHAPSETDTDVALLYKAGTMIVPRFKLIAVPESRPMLLATGFPSYNDSIHFLVTHWEEGATVAAAYTLSAVSDSLKALNPHAKILTLGHFGISPEDNLMRETLAASDVVLLHGIEGNWYNPTRVLSRYGKGTYRPADETWQMPDQVLLSGALLRGQPGVRYQQASVRIAESDFLFDDDGYPAPVFEGNRYAGGYGQNLPLIIRLEKPQYQQRRQMATFPMR